MELFFLNAKSCVHKVRCPVCYVQRTPDGLEVYREIELLVFSCSNEYKAKKAIIFSIDISYPTPPP